MWNMAFTAVDRTMIAVYRDREPTDDEWTTYLEAVAEHGLDHSRHHIVTDGGGPNPNQRKRLNELLAGRASPVAVVTGSTAVRGITTALSWFNREIRAFSHAEFEGALRHLKIPVEQAAIYRSRVKILQSQLDGSRPA